ncbi:MAG: plastocyanin/azurin family copper-binding protein [Microthrixaceae bacterium]
MSDTTTTKPETAGSAAASPTPSTPAATAAPQPKSTTFESLAVVGLILGLFSIVIAMFALGLAARAASNSGGGGGSGAAGGGTGAAEVDVTMADFSFDPSEAVIAPDGTIELTNDGSVQHDMVIDGQESGLIDPGASGSLQLDGIAAGEYEIYCSVPGHRDAGMEGTLTVD